MLEEDKKTFLAKYPEANDFIKAAKIREECWLIAREEYPSEEQVEELKEFLCTPACRTENWFLIIHDIEWWNNYFLGVNRFKKDFQYMAKYNKKEK